MCPAARVGTQRDGRAVGSGPLPARPVPQAPAAPLCAQAGAAEHLRPRVSVDWPYGKRACGAYARHEGMALDATPHQVTSP